MQVTLNYHLPSEMTECCQAIDSGKAYGVLRKMEGWFSEMLKSGKAKEYRSAQEALLDARDMLLTQLDDAGVNL